MTSLPVAIAVDARATQMNMLILFTGFAPIEMSVNDNILHLTRSRLMYTFATVHEVWYLTAIGEYSMDMKITDTGLAHLLDTYAQQAQKEAQR